MVETGDECGAQQWKNSKPKAVSSSVWGEQGKGSGTQSSVLKPLSCAGTGEQGLVSLLASPPKVQARAPISLKGGFCCSDTSKEATNSFSTCMCQLQGMASLQDSTFHQGPLYTTQPWDVHTMK